MKPAILCQTSPTTMDSHSSTSCALRSMCIGPPATVTMTLAVSGWVCKPPDLHRIAWNGMPARSSSSRTWAASFSLPLSKALSGKRGSVFKRRLAQSYCKLPPRVRPARSAAECCVQRSQLMFSMLHDGGAVLGRQAQTLKRTDSLHLDGPRAGFAHNRCQRDADDEHVGEIRIGLAAAIGVSLIGLRLLGPRGETPILEDGLADGRMPSLDHVPEGWIRVPFVRASHRTNHDV